MPGKTPADYGFQKTREHGTRFEYERTDLERGKLRITAEKYPASEDEWLVKLTAWDGRGSREEINSEVVYGRNSAEHQAVKTAMRAPDAGSVPADLDFS